MANYSYKYPKLNDRDWLYEQYMEKGLGTRDIAKLAGAKTPNSARQALKRYGIDVRTISDGLTYGREHDGFIFNDHTKEIIDGCLLGDGSLRSWNVESENSFPFFHKKNIGYDHILYVAKQIFNFEPENRIEEEYSNGFRCFKIRTLSHKELKDIQKIWYPKSNLYKKEVPESINITSEVLLHWFMDDGSSYLRKRNDYKSDWNKPNKQIVIIMCTESFNRDNQEMLAEKIRNKFEINFTVGKCGFGTGWRMFLSQSQVESFYEILGKCPVKSMEYKWK